MIRLLAEADVARAKQLSDAAGWNQTEEDWRLLIEMEPDACFGYESDGWLVATTTLVSYGETLAWIGMVLTDAAYRGKGIARQLVAKAIQVADARKIPTIKLDATDMGRPLYKSLGFQDEQPIERWSRDGSPAGPQPDYPTHPIPTYDVRAFGANRTKVLGQLAKRARLIVADGGYVMSRPGARAGYIGPCVAFSPSVAEQLIEAVLDGWQYMDVLASTWYVVEVAERLGFQRVRQLTRMRRGLDLFPSDERNVYAIAGFEWG
jgi:GNAT superfamily N-acetyltransferase